MKTVSEIATQVAVSMMASAPPPSAGKEAMEAHFAHVLRSCIPVATRIHAHIAENLKEAPAKKVAKSISKK